MYIHMESMPKKDEPRPPTSLKRRTDLVLASYFCHLMPNKLNMNFLKISTPPLLNHVLLCIQSILRWSLAYAEKYMFLVNTSPPTHPQPTDEMLNETPLTIPQYKVVPLTIPQCNTVGGYYCSIPWHESGFASTFSISISIA
jgi:hypothetical protein